MKTLFTFIIKLEAWSTIDVDGEVDNCVEALEQRYSASCTLTVPVPASPNTSSWEAVIDKDPTLSRACEVIPEFTAKYTDIGVFVASHGCPGQVGGVTGSQLAKLLLKLNFSTLRKINVLACSTARGDPPLCQRSCRLNRIGTFGGADSGKWLDTDKLTKIG
jgi:hypothetical protein